MKKGVIRRVLSYVRPYRFAFAVSLIGAAAFVAAELALPVLFGKVADLIIGEGNVDFDGLARIFIVAAACALFAGLMQWTTEAISNKIANGVTERIRNDAFEKLQRAPLSVLDARPAGDILSVEIGDADRLADGLLLGFSRFFTGIITIIGTLAVMFVLNPVIAAVVAVLTPASLFTAKFITGKTYGTFKKQAEITGRQSALIEESLGNLPTIKAYSAEEEFIKKFDDVNGELEKTSLKAVFFSSLTNPTTRFINAVVYAAVAFTGAMLAASGAVGVFAVTAGLLLSLLGYAGKYAKPFNEISSVLTELTGAKACAARLFEVIDGEEETPDVKNAAALSGVKGDVKAEGVCFSYVPERPLIENFNLDVRSGRKTAIVGPTGCGKTTLINLLMRFYDVNSGEISVDGIPIKDVKRRELRRSYGMVLQDTWIRKATVKDNIKIGKKDATDEEIERAAKLAGCDGFIKRLPDGYETVIGDDDLSAGQRQLISIARVMLRVPPMLILDEATSSVDTRTEKKISEAFDELTKGKTSFIVAHRLSTIVSADNILVMKDGNVIEQGTHAELMEKRGFYCELYNSQFEKN